MKLLSLRALLLILLEAHFCGFVSSATSESRVIEVLQSGFLGTHVNTKADVWCLEEDAFIPGNILFSDGNTLMTSDGKTADLVVGSDYGYAEGRSAQAKFRLITGILQTNSTHVLLVEHFSHCLRYVSRVTNQTSPFAGTCTISGFSDGQRNIARFSYPASMTKYLDHVIVTDSDNKALRSVELANGYVRTYAKDLPDKPWTAVLDSKKENIFITFDNFVVKFNIEAKKIFPLMPVSNRGGQDGELSKASFGSAKGILCMNETCLVADLGLNKLRILDLSKKTMSSVCTGTSAQDDGNSATCSLRSPVSLLLKSNTLYIGGYRAIRKFSAADPCRSSPCLNVGKCIAGVDDAFVCTCKEGWTGQICQHEVRNVSCEKHIYGVGDSKTLRADILLPGGDIITLPVGVFSFRKLLPYNLTCEITIQVSDPRLTRRMDILANYKVPCNLLSDFRDLIHSIAQTRYTQIRMLSSHKCNRSADYDVIISCNADALVVVWPTGCLFDASQVEEKNRIVSVVTENLKKSKDALLDLVVPSHKPPIIQPALNQDGLLASVVLTPVCLGGLQYLNSTQTCQ